jgi:hypothetical protein
MAGFEVIMVVAMKSSVFWDITPCSLLKVTQRFGGTCHLHKVKDQTSVIAGSKQSQLACLAYSAAVSSGSLVIIINPHIKYRFTEAGILLF